jgi:hypothetical protein
LPVLVIEMINCALSLRAPVCVDWLLSLRQVIYEHDAVGSEQGHGLA